MIANSLKRFRDQLGYSQEGIATSIGMKQTTWSGWENKPPDALQWLVKLSERHGVSIDYMLGLSDNPLRSTNAHAGSPPRALQLMDYLRHSSEAYEGALLDIADVMKRLEMAARASATSEMVSVALRYIRMHFGDDAAEELYRAVELLRHTGDDSALTAWFTRYLGGNKPDDTDE